MGVAITFRDLDSQATWAINFPVCDYNTIKEQEAVEDMCLPTTPACYCCYVNRTHNWKSFSKDFFLPTFVNFVLKIEDVTTKIIAGIFAIAFDLVTLPLRLVFLPCGYLSNKVKYEQNPLVQYLKKHGASQQILQAERLILQIQKRNTDGTDYYRVCYAALRIQPSRRFLSYSKDSMLTEAQIQNLAR